MVDARWAGLTPRIHRLGEHRHKRARLVLVLKGVYSGEARSGLDGLASQEHKYLWGFAHLGFKLLVLVL